LRSALSVLKIQVSDKTTPEFMEQIHQRLVQEQAGYQFALSQLVVPGFALLVCAHFTQLAEKGTGLCHGYIREQWFQRAPVFCENIKNNIN